MSDRELFSKLTDLMTDFNRLLEFKDIYDLEEKRCYVNSFFDDYEAALLKAA